MSKYCNDVLLKCVYFGNIKFNYVNNLDGYVYKLIKKNLEDGLRC